MPQALFDFIDANQTRFLDRLYDLLRQPSVAAQNLGIKETAEHVAELLNDLGADVQIVLTKGHPVVVGQLEGKAEKTLSFYNHYDVQPPEPLDLWESDPYAPEIRDGKLYARGVADNKGNLIARINAVEAYKAVHGELPCNIKFIVEGEEEIGSPNLDGFADHHADLIKADGCIWEFGGKDLQDRPMVTLGVKGITYVELSVKTSNSDLHSSWAAVVPNAAWRLVWALQSLKGPDDRILIEGFYDDIDIPNDLDLEALQALGFDEAGHKQTFGIDAFNNGLSGIELLKKLYFEPTCTICGFESGYQGPGAKTVSPNFAKVKLDFRMVPGQDPEHVVAALRQHLDTHGFEDIHLDVLAGEKAGRTPLDSPLAKLGMETAQLVYDHPPVLQPISAGSGPMYTLCQQFGIPSISSGCGYPGSQIHAPNEHIRVEDYWQSIKHAALIIDRFALI